MDRLAARALIGGSLDFSSKAAVLDSVSRETGERLAAYVGVLSQWSTKLNLIGPATEASIWSRHVADSLQLQRLIPSGVSQAADFGSGAGLPGLILAIATAIPFILVESDLRKSAFLREAIRVTGAPATVVASRVETLTASVDLVTARALAPLATLLTLTPPAIRDRASFLLPKGASVQTELDEARQHYSFDLDMTPSLTDTRGVILILSHVRPR